MSHPSRPAHTRTQQTHQKSNASGVHKVLCLTSSSYSLRLGNARHRRIPRQGEDMGMHWKSDIPLPDAIAVFCNVDSFMLLLFLVFRGGLVCMGRVSTPGPLHLDVQWRAQRGFGLHRNSTSDKKIDTAKQCFARTQLSNAMHGAGASGKCSTQVWQDINMRIRRLGSSSYPGPRHRQAPWAVICQLLSSARVCTVAASHSALKIRLAHAASNLRPSRSSRRLAMEG